MKSTYEIIKAYTAGENGLEETNAALKEAGAGYHLEPGQNELTDGDRRETVVGYYPNQATGYGLLDTGTGSMEKVYVYHGRLQVPVNQVQPDGSTNMAAYVIICGKVYEVLGDKLSEIPDEDCDACKVPPLPIKADLRRRTDLAGQMVEQRTKSGVYLVTYDAQGYAVRSVRKEAK